ncbi:hypothetical protein GIB67_005516 [Kingdonia uniflora]|uniref:Uncharacterized protein n=1 Tax=Kingdonia uniflora TaxID=39325 RepID=A0A7J7NI41_9MAGN|nr:hypothetical protein GIB67_005516 [Kingdonia uniflora]
MGSHCRSAAMASVRSLIVFRSQSVISKTLTPTPTPKSMPSMFPLPTRTSPCISRIAKALGGAESLMPLHSAIASARLISIIAADSSCWSSLSQDFAVPR